MDIDSSQSNNDEERISTFQKIETHFQCVYETLTLFPQPLAEITHKHYHVEDWEIYKRDFYARIDKLSKHTDILLMTTMPLHILWLDLNTESAHKDTITKVFDSPQSMLTLYKQSRCILALAEEYLLLSHFYMPSWRVLTTENVANTNKPMELLFFCELCKIRAIVSVLYDMNNKNPSNRVPALNTIHVQELRSLSIIPPNVFNWKIQLPNKESNIESIPMIPYYTQEQVEISNKYLFLNLNLVSFTPALAIYIEEILNRQSWLCIAPYDEEVLNHKQFRYKLDPHIIADGDNFLDVENINSSNNTINIYSVSMDYIYRCILRYYELLLKTAPVLFLFKLVKTQPNKLPKMTIEFSHWLQKCVNEKFVKTASMMKNEVAKKYEQLLMPPSDIEWVKYKHPIQYINETSVWTILYPDLKVLMVETAGKDIKKLYTNPSVVDAIIFEYIVLNLVTKIFAGEFDLMQLFVKLQTDIIRDLEEIKSDRKMPILLQSFNRFNMFYKKEMVEYSNIFDTIGDLFCIMIQDFPKEGVTHSISLVLNKQKQELIIGEREKKKATSQKDKPQQATVENFSTLQTTLIDDPILDETSGIF